MKHSRRAGVVLLVLAGLPFASCGGAGEAAQDYVDHVEDQPLDGGTLLRAAGGVRTGDSFSIPWMEVIFRIDGAAQMAEDPDRVARNLASVMKDACDFDPPESGMGEVWRIERLGPWLEADAGLLIGHERFWGNTERCADDQVLTAATTLVTSINAAARVSGMEPMRTVRGKFRGYTVDRRSSMMPAARALAPLAAYDRTVIDIHDNNTDVRLGPSALKSSTAMRQLEALLEVVPPGRRLASEGTQVVCRDCRRPDRYLAMHLALALVVDGTDGEVARWARAAGIPTVPTDGQLLLVSNDHGLLYYRAELNRFRG